MTEATSRTDEDIVNDAFKVGLGGIDDDGDDNDEDDQIVWNPAGGTSEAASPQIHAVPLSPVRSWGSAVGQGMPSSGPHSPRTPLSPMQQGAVKTPIGSPRTSSVPALTAQDLLLDVMNAGRRPSSTLVPTFEAGKNAGMGMQVQPPLLFGSELAHAPTQSIWSASQEEQTKRRFGAGAASPRVRAQGLQGDGGWTGQGSAGLGVGQPGYSHGVYSPHMGLGLNGPNGGNTLNPLNHPLPTASNSSVPHFYGSLSLNDPGIHSHSTPHMGYQQGLGHGPSPLSGSKSGSFYAGSGGGPQGLLAQQQQKPQGWPEPQGLSHSLSMGYYDGLGGRARVQQQQQAPLQQRHSSGQFMTTTTTPPTWRPSG